MPFGRARALRKQEERETRRGRGGEPRTAEWRHSQDNREFFGFPFTSFHSLWLVLVCFAVVRARSHAIFSLSHSPRGPPKWLSRIPAIWRCICRERCVMFSDRYWKGITYFGLGGWNVAKWLRSCKTVGASLSLSNMPNSLNVKTRAPTNLEGPVSRLI